MIEFGDDVLAEYALGTLPSNDVAALEAAAAADSALRERVRSVGVLLAELAGALDPVEPPPALRERVLSSLARTNRFDRFTARVAGLLDLTRARAESLLAGIDDAASWVPGFADGISLYHLEGGPAVANALVGFVKMKAGLDFPHHQHVGEEIVLVLQGESTDEDGTVALPGDEIVKPPGSEHTFATSAKAPDYIYLAVVYEGVRIGDDLLEPNDPRF